MLLDYMLNRYSNVLENLTVFEDRMMKNIYITNGVIFSQRVLTKLIDKGLSRELAYDTIQPIAMNAWENGLQYKDLLFKNETVTKLLTPEEINDAFEVSFFLRNVDEIYARVGIK